MSKKGQGKHPRNHNHRGDTSIAAYRAKRDFSKTAEPLAEPSSPGPALDEPLFVVQKHQASHLH